MSENTPLTRQLMGCGYEPPADHRRAPVQPWYHSASVWPEDADGQGGPTTCPAYTTSLPEVIEAARGRFWRQDLRTFTGGARPTQALIAAIELLESESNQVQSWAMTPEKDGGGARGGG